MANDNKPVPVLFRADREGGQTHITAVFPTLPADNDGKLMTCYAHIGQHGAASLEWYRTTRPARPDEYADLKRELESAPFEYVLDVRQRLNAELHAERRYAANTAIPARAIEVWEERFGEPRRVARHDRVPRDWLARDVLERFGIGDHLAVYEVAPDGSRVKTIQPGRQRP